MKISRILVLTLLTGAALALAGTAFAKEKREKRSFPDSKMIEELKLTPEQVAKIKEIREKNRPSNETFKADREKLRNAHRDLRNAMHSDASTDELRKKFEAVQTARPKCEERQALAQKRFEEILQIREILTPDQRKQFRGMMMDSKGGFGDGPGRGDRKGRRGGPPDFGGGDFPEGE